MIRTRLTRMPGICAALLFLSIATTSTRTAARADIVTPHGDSKVVVSFVFFGCNRIEQKDWEQTRSENPSSANMPQLRRNLADIAPLNPDLLFFGGDLVMGYADDGGNTLRQQLSSWIALVKSLPRSPKTQLVAITGNHEVNRKVGEQKLPNPIADSIWSALVKPAGLIPSTASGPNPKSDLEDNLVSDQRALSFSFDRGPVHFAILDTDTRVTVKDPTTGDTKIAMIPVHWLQADLDAAQRNRAIKCIVVMGHRNLIDPDSIKGDAPIDPDCGAIMTRVLESHSKVRAYICAHVHAFDISPIGKTGLLQTTFGNGGSKLEKGWDPPRGRTYGFGFFKVYEDGGLGVVPYLRPEPKNYVDESPANVPAATAEPEIIVRPRT